MCDGSMERMLSERDALMLRDYDAALDLARFEPQDTVLDVGTGSGRMLLQVVKRGYAVFSGDIDQAALDKARGRLGDLAGKPTLLLMDAHELQFDDDTFHAATFANAIHEIDDPRGALDEIARVLSSDGKLLVIEFNAQGYGLMEAYHRTQGRGEHPRGEMSTEEIDRYLRQSFCLVETREFGITHAWVASRKVCRSGR